MLPAPRRFFKQSFFSVMSSKSNGDIWSACVNVVFSVSRFLFFPWMRMRMRNKSCHSIKIPDGLFLTLISSKHWSSKEEKRSKWSNYADYLQWKAIRWNCTSSSLLLSLQQNVSVGEVRKKTSEPMFCWFFPHRSWLQRRLSPVENLFSSREEKRWIPSDE